MAKSIKQIITEYMDFRRNTIIHDNYNLPGYPEIITYTDEYGRHHDLSGLYHSGTFWNNNIYYSSGSEYNTNYIIPENNHVQPKPENKVMVCFYCGEEKETMKCPYCGGRRTV